MMSPLKKVLRVCVLITSLLLLNTSYAYYSMIDPSSGSMFLQMGIYDSAQGESQNIGITNLIGDHFSVTRRHDQNILLGLGYYVPGAQSSWYRLMYGANIFYLAPTATRGKVTQENRFTNLSYTYKSTHIPLYLAVKSLFDTSNPRYSVTLDLGLGINFMYTGDFSEQSLDGGITLPDRPFSSSNEVKFSGTLGLGLQINNVWGCLPLEIGYRFFYLGEGHLKKRSQVLDDLDTGKIYANALVITLSV